jgi:hypothetical protein
LMAQANIQIIDVENVCWGSCLVFCTFSIIDALLFSIFWCLKSFSMYVFNFWWLRSFSMYVLHLRWLKSLLFQIIYVIIHLGFRFYWWLKPIFK